MSRRNAAAAPTKRRHSINTNYNNKMTAKAPPKSDWLSVFAAASLFIPDEVLEGSLFPMTSTTSTSTSATSSSSSRLPTARDFGPIVFHDPAKFYQRIGRLYAALQKEKDRNDRNDNNRDADPTAADPLAGIRICTTDPNPFMDRFRKYGYAVVDGKYHPAAKRVYVRRTKFHVVPDADTVGVVSAALTSLGYKRCDKRRLLRNGNCSKSTSASGLAPISAQWPATGATAGSGIVPTKAKARSKAKAKARSKGGGGDYTTHWLDVFAAVAMYMDNCVMRGCLLAHAQQPGAGGNAKNNVKFDRLIIYSRPRFFRAAHHLYSAIEREQMTGGDPALASIRIVCPAPETFEVQLGRFGYRRVDDGASMDVMGGNGRTENEIETEEEEEQQQQQQPEVYARNPAFPAHIAPNAERALIIYNVLERMDFTPKQEFGPPCPSEEGARTCIPHPSPTTVADTGLSMTVDNGNDGSDATTTTDAITTTATRASKSIPELYPRRHFEAPTGSTFVGKVGIDKNIVPTPIAHHAATTALRIATMSSATKPPTDTLGISWGYIPGTTGRTVHSAIPPPPPPPLSFMRSNSQIKEDGVFEGPIAVTRPELITIDDDNQYPPLPGSTSTATGKPFVPWADMTEAQVSDVPEGTGVMAADDDLNIPEWSKIIEEYHDGQNLSPIGAKEGMPVPNDEDGDDHLSVMSTSSPIISAIAEDDVSSCPSMNCDDQDEALIPFINY